MGRYPRKILLVLSLGVLAALLVPQAVAVAQEYPANTLVVTQVNGLIAVSGDGCGINQVVTISLDGAVVATTTTNASGHFSTSFTPPAGTTPGAHTVTAFNSSCELAGVVQVEAATAARLAFTGSSGTISTVWIAAGLLALGGVFVMIARRRKPNVRTH